MPWDTSATRQRIREVRRRLEALLDGMDYCLDWRPGPNEWSAREVVYHLLTTPPEGLGAALREVVEGGRTELTLPWGQPGLRPQDREKDLPDVLADVRAFFASLEELLEQHPPERLETARFTAHLPVRNRSEERSVAAHLERQLSSHWPEHLEQLAQVREALGVET